MLICCIVATFIYIVLNTLQGKRYMLLMFQSIFKDTTVVSYTVVDLGQRFTHVDSWDDIF